MLNLLQIIIIIQNVAQAFNTPKIEEPKFGKKAIFRQARQDVHQVIKNLAAYDDSGQFRCEVDLLVIHNQTGIVVKCKSHLSVNDVDEQVNRMNIFKNCFPQYAGFVLWGAVAAVVVPDDVARYAHDKGLYVLAQKTETVRIRNSD